MLPCRRRCLLSATKVSVRVAHLAAERDESLFVHVRRARTEHAAAGQRNFGAAEPAEQRADDIERGGQLAHERVRRAPGSQRCWNRS